MGFLVAGRFRVDKELTQPAHGGVSWRVRLPGGSREPGVRQPATMRLRSRLCASRGTEESQRRGGGAEAKGRDDLPGATESFSRTEPETLTLCSGYAQVSPAGPWGRPERHRQGHSKAQTLFGKMAPATACQA